MSNSDPLISFIIPAKNEEVLLPQTLKSIRQYASDLFVYEIIVVDNDSTDSTPSIAETYGACVISKETGTIGALRNAGSRIAKGKFLVFLDADVSITQQWCDVVGGVLQNIADDMPVITGSRCSVAEDAGWIADAWFRRAPMEHETTHVGTGHMIVGREAFDKLGGFDESLRTGEDYEFCERAKRQGGRVFENRNLRVVHYGVPATLLEFAKREVWHGSGDAESLSNMLKSKVAVLSLLFLLAHIWLVVSLIVSADEVMLYILPALLVLLIVAGSAIKKYYFSSVGVVLKNMVLYYFYFWGRSLSLLYRVFHIKESASPRVGR